MAGSVLIGGGAEGQAQLALRYANRHGLVAGATGTGKTVTLQCLAESFSDAGVPVFLADVKGDIAGLAQPGTASEHVARRNASIGIDDYHPRPYPIALWDLFGKDGVPIRTTISEMGPQLLARLLDLNDTQEGVLTLVFEYADDEGLLLLDLDDLRTSLTFLADHAGELETAVRVARGSVDAILRRLLVLERSGGDHFFGEPALALEDLMQRARDGRGIINVLAAQTLINNPRVYAMFLLWLLSEMFETLPELGDPDQPVLVFFFDEAHLLFRDAPKVLLDKVEQVVRLIRSKGVGIYFVTQSPADIPDRVLGQLGNRVQHALRAYTPRERKAVRVAAESFRPNPAIDTVTAIGELGLGEALVSTLGDRAVPTPVQRVLIRPPHSRMGPLSESERSALLAADPNQRRYGEAVDQRSAHEILLERVAATAAAVEKEEPAATRPARRSNRESAGEAFVKSVARSLGSATGRRLGKRLLRGILGSLSK